MDSIGFLSSYVDISMYCVCFLFALLFMLFIARFLFQIGLGILGLFGLESKIVKVR